MELLRVEASVAIVGIVHTGVRRGVLKCKSRQTVWLIHELTAPPLNFLKL
jgi:hypothetical protein